MKSLRVMQAKPNPSGKDRSRTYTPPALLAAEWVDFKNAGDEAFALDGVSLYHIAYQPGCRNGQWRIVTSFKNGLDIGKIVRVHSGAPILLTSMHPEDALGVDFHLFTGMNNYVWNNDCGDSAGLWNGSSLVDKAAYDPYPPEGAILTRVGDKLIPVEVTTSSAYGR